MKWTPPLFGWQYPIQWYEGNTARVLGLPQGAGIWTYQGSWIAVFQVRRRLSDPAHLRCVDVLIRERSVRLHVVVRRLEHHLRSLGSGLDAFRG